MTPGAGLLAMMESAGSCESNVATRLSNVLGTTDLYPKAKVQGKAAIRSAPLPGKAGLSSPQLSQKLVFSLLTVSVVS